MSIRRFFLHSILSLSVFFLTLLVLEVALRFDPEILGQGIANQILSKYYVGRHGIYGYDKKTGFNFMKPDYSTQLYSNGYVWEHTTDSYGFRNPAEHPFADIVLLGDSLIYGHGVEQDQTVGYFLEEMSEYTVVNLARQGDTAFQQKYILYHYGREYQPVFVFYFFYENDINDLGHFLTPEEMDFY